MHRLVATAAAALALATTAGTVASATADPADVIEVFPGPGALGAALSSAGPGDTLLLHAGTYRDAVTVNDAGLTITTAGDGLVIVDAKCAAQFTIAVRADDVTIDGLRVQGAAEGFGSYPAEVDFTDVASGLIRNSVMRDTCDAEYGVNVLSVLGVTIEDNVMSGFSDAGIYIGSVDEPSSNSVVVQRNRASGNERGIILEDSPGTPAATIVVAGNRVTGNASTEILVHNTDRAQLRRNTVTGPAEFGILLDTPSDHNRLSHNTVSGHTFDLANDGGRTNCFVANTYTTSRGPIGC